MCCLRTRCLYPVGRMLLVITLWMSLPILHRSGFSFGADSGNRLEKISLGKSLISANTGREELCTRFCTKFLRNLRMMLNLRIVRSNLSNYLRGSNTLRTSVGVRVLPEEPFFSWACHKSAKSIRIRKIVRIPHVPLTISGWPIWITQTFRPLTV